MTQTAQAPFISGGALSGSRPLPVLRRTLAETWRSTLGWALGLTAVLLLYLPLYPSMANSQMTDLINSLPPQLVRTLGYAEIATGPGYAQATFFGLMGFALLSIAGVSWGSAAIAGAEESGRLELTLAHGVSRVQYGVESALAIVVRLLVLVGYVELIVAMLNGPTKLDLEAGKTVAGGAALFGLSLLTAGVALAAGALTGRRTVATAAGAVVAALGYVLNAIGNQTPDLAWVRRLSPYHWAFGHRPLVEGADWTGLGLLAGFSVLVLAVAVAALQRRDVLG